MAAALNYIINEQEEGNVVMDGSNDHGITMPTALMDVGHYFDGVTWRCQCNWATENY
jgi:hypothetical protein